MRKQNFFGFSFFLCVTALLTSGCEKKLLDPKTEPSESVIQSVQTELTEPEITPENKDAYPILFSFHDLYGYLDEKMQVIVLPIYDRATHFSANGYACVRRKNDDGRLECLILDRNGDVLFQAYTAMMINLYDDIVTYQPDDSRVSCIFRFRENTTIADGAIGSNRVAEDGILLVRFYDSNEWGYIDSSGTRLFPNLKLYRMSVPFREQRAVISSSAGMNIIDMEGTIISSLDFSHLGSYFSEGLLPARTKDGLTGYIDQSGDFAFTVPLFLDAEDYAMASFMVTEFKSGYALVQVQQDPSLWRVINNQGQYVTDELAIFSAEAFSEEGLSVARLKLHNTECIYINTKGESVINLIFEKGDSFHQGHARIIYQGRDGILNTEGQIFWSDEILAGNPVARVLHDE